jgi:hypothetical protein
LTTDALALDKEVVAGFIFDAPSLTSTGDEPGPGPALRSSLSQGPSRVFIDSAPESSHRVAGAVYLFSKRLSTMSELRAVAHSTERGVHLVWSFIDRRDKRSRARIYEEERRLMVEFPDLTFDFNVVSLDQFSGGPFVPDDVQGQIVFYRQP